jgi:hypothetical protein
VAQRRHHYEHAFERFLRDQRIPYISVDEAKKSLLPAGAVSGRGGDSDANQKLKNFDFVIYGRGGNLLVEVKGRRLPAVRLKDGCPGTPRMESWVTADDLDALARWGALFGPGFEPMLVFVYWCADVPPDGLFVETIAHRGRWYTMRCIDLESYRSAMRVRSARWGTVALSTSDFARLSRPFGVPGWTADGSGVGMRMGGGTGGGDRGGGGSCTGFVREPVFEAMG